MTQSIPGLMVLPIRCLRDFSGLHLIEVADLGEILFYQTGCFLAKASNAADSLCAKTMLVGFGKGN